MTPYAHKRIWSASKGTKGVPGDENQTTTEKKTMKKNWGLWYDCREIRESEAERHNCYCIEDVFALAEEEFGMDDGAELLCVEMTHDEAVAELAKHKCELRDTRFHVGMGWIADMYSICEIIDDEEGEPRMGDGDGFAEWVHNDPYYDDDENDDEEEND